VTGISSRAWFVDAAGEPLEGVQVSAGAVVRGGPDRRGPPPDMSQWRLRGFPQELTDAGGRFTLTGLAPGMYRVRATRSQAAPRGPRGFATASRPRPAHATCASCCRPRVA
jgi:protocatechuate 3,4-dioxygenase beta subunit